MPDKINENQSDSNPETHKTVTLTDAGKEAVRKYIWRITYPVLAGSSLVTIILSALTFFWGVTVKEGAINKAVKEIMKDSMKEILEASRSAQTAKSAAEQASNAAKAILDDSARGADAVKTLKEFKDAFSTKDTVNREIANLLKGDRDFVKKLNQIEISSFYSRATSESGLKFHNPIQVDFTPGRFSKPPTVSLALAGITTPLNGLINVTVKVQEGSITERGFTAVINTDDHRCDDVTCFWIACEN